MTSGIVCVSSSSPTITNCFIIGDNYHGISCYDASSTALTNCLIASNESDGIYCIPSEDLPEAYTGHSSPIALSSPIVINCTVTDNQGYGINCEGSSPTVSNSIIWGNKTSEFSYNSAIVSYSNIRQDTGVYPGIGNLNTNPIFMESDKGNYALQSSSPCRDTGSLTDAPQEDREGIARPQGLGVDMGAYNMLSLPLVFQGLYLWLIRPQELLPLPHRC